MQQNCKIKGMFKRATTRFNFPFQAIARFSGKRNLFPQPETTTQNGGGHGVDPGEFTKILYPRMSERPPILYIHQK
jgi:hypothetical protein